MMATKKIISGILAAVTLLASALALPAAAEESAAAEPQVVEVYCPSNDDSEFPFNIELDFSEDSIRYVDFDEPVYGIESILDGEALDFNMNISLKDDYMDFDGYEFQLFSSNYTEDIASVYAESEETISIPGLSIGKGYKMSMTLESDSLTTYYGGEFTIQVELDSTVVVDLFYQLASMEGDAASYAYPYLDEKEPSNNNSKTPDTLYSDRTTIGHTNYVDCDYFQYTAPRYNYNGERFGIVNLSFTFKVDPTDESIYFYIIDDNGKEVQKILTQNGVGVYFFKIPNVELGKVYKLMIDSACDEEIEYAITPTYKCGLAWYGQYVSKEGGSEYWNAEPIEKLQIKYGYDTKPLFRENSSIRGDEAWMTQSCGIVASAMALRNIGATTNKYDFRSGQSNGVLADPYTATLANCDYSIGGNSTIYVVDNTNNPRILLHQTIASNFNVGNRSVETGRLWYPYFDEDDLMEWVDTYHCVLVRFQKPNISYNHFMLITGYDASQTDFAKKYLVYDPAASTYSKGAGVELSLTGYPWNDVKLENIISITYFK